MTAVLAGAGFLLLVPAVWIDDSPEGLWRVWGCVSLAALACSHASLVTASIGLAAIDAFAGILPLADLVDDVDEGVAKVIGVLLIALLLTTALPPIMRRLQGPAAPALVPAPEGPGPSARPWGLAAEVLAAAERIERLSPGDERLSPECERLRSIARATVGEPSTRRS